MANNFSDAVTIPAAQAAITGALSGILAGGVAGLVHFPQAAQFGLTAGAGVALVAWLDYRGRWQYILESLLNVDLNQDGQIGDSAHDLEPAQTNENHEPVKVIIEHDQGRHLQFIDLPAEPGQLTAFADGVLEGRSLSQAAWTGRGQPFSRSEYDAFRDELIRRGLAQWRSPGEPAQGWELLASGRAVLRHFESDTPTTPQKAARVVRMQ